MPLVSLSLTFSHDIKPTDSYSQQTRLLTTAMCCIQCQAQKYRANQQCVNASFISYILGWSYHQRQGYTVCASFCFVLKKHNANRRQTWLFISAPSEVVTGIITEEKLQGLFQWHFSCCSRQDKRLKVFLTYLQSKDASVSCSGYFQVD